MKKFRNLFSRPGGGSSSSRTVQKEQEHAAAAAELRQACSQSPPDEAVIRSLLLLPSSSPNDKKHKRKKQQQQQRHSSATSRLLQVPNKNGDLPVHLAVYNGASLDVVQLLVHGYPESLSHLDNQGSLPLHWACFGSATFLVIQNLLLQYPDSVHVETNNGQLPLHYAVAATIIDTTTTTSMTTTTDKSMTASTNTITTTTTTTGSTGMGRSATETWKVVQCLVQKYPMALQHVNTTNGFLPLHIACSNPTMTLTIIQYMVEQYPSSVTQQSHDGQLPIDRTMAVVCSNSNNNNTNGTSSSTYAIIEYLQSVMDERNNSSNSKSKSRTSATTTTSSSNSSRSIAGRSASTTTTATTTVVANNVHEQESAIRSSPASASTPLTLRDSITTEAQLLHACSNANVTVSELEDILHRDPQAIMARTQKGMRPLHIACWKGASAPVVDYLISQWPESISARTTREWIPLHVACASSHPPDDHDALQRQVQVVETLVRHWEESVHAKDNKERLPLHIACFSGAPLAAVQCLVDSWPDSVMAVNMYASLPLHLACGTRASLNVIQYLVQCQPESLRALDSEGRTPLDLAHHPLEIHPRQSLNAESSRQLNEQQGLSHEQPDGETVAWLEAVYDSMDRKERKQQGHFEKDRTKLAQVVSGAKDKPVSLSVKYVEHLMTSTTTQDPQQEQEQQVLGKGHFGVVVMGTDTVLKQKFAIKSLAKRALLVGGTKDDLERVKKDFKREQKGLLRFRHPNIALLYGYCLSDSQRKGEYLVYQLAEKGSLDHFWSCQLGRERLASFGRRAQIALDTFIGLRFLHVGNKYIKPCFHRDLKSANIVLQRDMTAQLIDCGMATFAQGDGDERMGMSTGVKGTRGYVCPKYCTGSIAYDAACDIFSFSIVLAELWSGQLQNHRDANGRVYNYYEQYINEGRSMNDDLDKAFGFGIGDKMPLAMNEYKNLALDCMAKSPRKRPSSEDVMDRLEIIWHSFENDIQDDEDNDELESDASESRGEIEEDSRESDNESDEKEVNVTVSDEGLHVYESNESRGSSESDTADVESGQSTINYIDGNASTAEAAAAAKDQEDAMESQVSRTDSGVDVSTCRLCRTYAADDDVEECLMCLALQEKRDAIANAVSSKLDADSPQVQNFKYPQNAAVVQQHGDDDAAVTLPMDLRLNNSIPRLFVIVPEALKHGWKHPNTWLRRKVATKYNLFFICGHTYQIMRPSIQLIVSSAWIEKIALSLALSLTLLQLAAAKTTEELNGHDGVDGGGGGGSSSLSNFHPSQLNEMLQEVETILKEQCTEGLAILERIRTGIRLSDRDIALLNGETYELVVEKARENREWRNVMEPVRKRRNGNGTDPHIVWVSRIVCMDPESNYEVINV